MIVMCFFCVFNDTATTEIYTLSLHDALPILVEQHESVACERGAELLEEDQGAAAAGVPGGVVEGRAGADRKSTRLNSSHANISYAVFCLKKKHNDAMGGNSNFSHRRYTVRWR